MIPFQRHRQRFYDNMPSRGGAMSGGCTECGGICGGAQSPRQLMEQVLQHAEDGHITGGEIAEIIHEYTAKGMHGAGFFSSLWHGIKKVAGVVAPVLSMVPGLGSVAGNVLGAVAGSGRRRVGTKKRPIKRRRITRRM